MLAARAAAGLPRRARRLPVQGAGAALRRLIASATALDSGAAPTVDDAIEWLHAELADDVVALDVRQVMEGCAGDWLVFATAKSHAHMKRLASATVLELKQRGVTVGRGAPTIEGEEGEDGWMLVDGGRVVVNVMVEEARIGLALEDHWEEMGAVAHEIAHHREPPLSGGASAAAPALAESRGGAREIEGREIGRGMDEAIYEEDADLELEDADRERGP